MVSVDGETDGSCEQLDCLSPPKPATSRLVKLAKFLITCFLSSDDTLIAELCPTDGLLHVLSASVAALPRLSHDPLKRSMDNSDWLLAILPSHWLLPSGKLSTDFELQCITSDKHCCLGDGGDILSDALVMRGELLSDGTINKLVVSKGSSPSDNLLRDCTLVEEVRR